VVVHSPEAQDDGGRYWESFLRRGRLPAAVTPLFLVDPPIA
jgi:hypothetical protein